MVWDDWKDGFGKIARRNPGLRVFLEIFKTYLLRLLRCGIQETLAALGLESFDGDKDKSATLEAKKCNALIDPKQLKEDANSRPQTAEEQPSKNSVLCNESKLRTRLEEG